MGWLIQRSGGVAAHGYEQGFFVGGLLLVAGGLIGIVTMNPQRSGVRLAPVALERAPT